MLNHLPWVRLFRVFVAMNNRRMNLWRVCIFRWHLFSNINSICLFMLISEMSPEMQNTGNFYWWQPLQQITVGNQRHCNPLEPELQGVARYVLETELRASRTAGSTMQNYPRTWFKRIFYSMQVWLQKKKFTESEIFHSINATHFKFSVNIGLLHRRSQQND